MCRQFLLAGVVCLGLAAGLPLAAWAQEFVLDVPGEPALRSAAVLTARGLTITDAQGRRHVYVPHAEADSAGGAYLGYYSAEARQFLRWPASGEGAMFTGVGAGREIAWKKSLMQVRRAGGRDPLAVRPRAEALRAGPLNLAALPGRGGALIVAYVDESGALRMYEGREGRWKPLELGLHERLPPGAPLVLAADRGSAIPLVYAVNERGELIEIREGARVRSVLRREDPRFVPQSHLALLGGRGVVLAGVDERGQLWQIDAERGACNEIEARGGIFEPGIPLAGVVGAAEELFLVDRRGNLLRYAFDRGRWSRPTLLAGGFSSGGFVAALSAPLAVGRAETLLVASIDGAGRPHVFAEDAGGLTDEILPEARLAAGAPVSLASDDRGLLFSAIGLDGRWLEWQRRGGAWAPREIANGFQPGSMVLYARGLPAAFAVDRGGRLIAGRFVNGAWENAILSPRFARLAFAPRLVSRAIVPNEPLPPATIELENRHTEELVLRIHAPLLARPAELSIAPGKSVPYKIERDAGATLEEVYLVPDPLLGLVEEVHRLPLPPQKLYDVVVYANRVASVYFDRTKGKKSPVPDEVNLSLVSLGVFPIPPADLVRDGERFDVYREAQAQRNPGAAALLDGNPGGK